MASKKDTWDVFREKMKDKRCKKAGNTRNNKAVSADDLILLKGELVIQRLSAEVSGKAQKYLVRRKNTAALGHANLLPMTTTK